jgi:hypothetical protein
LATEEAKSKALLECYKLSQAVCERNQTLEEQKICNLRLEQKQQELLHS